MASDKQPKKIPTIAQTIDAVLDTSAAKQILRPISKLRPSWIGPPAPERPVTPGLQAMKHHVSIEYSSPGLQPPVYIFTSLSNPQWDAVEMQTEQKADGQYRFFKDFDAEEGEYQYKFRLGPGDWWACDETKPTVDDGSGNKNNLIAINPPPTSPDQQSAASNGDKPAIAENPQANQQPSASSSDKPAAPETSPTDSSPPSVVLTRPDPQPQNAVTPAHEDVTSAPMLPSNSPSQTDVKSQPALTPAHEAVTAPTPLMKHETFVPDKGAEAEQTPEREDRDPFVGGQDDAESEQVLMKHETFKPTQAEETDSSSDEDDGDPSSSSDDDDGPDDEHTSPLLRHESLAPSSKEQEHSPLFRHESIALGYNHHEPAAAYMSPTRLSRKASSASSIPVEADPHDPTLESFPTDHAGIMDKIHRTSTTLPADEVDDDDNDADASSPISQAMSESSLSPPSLPSVREVEDEEQLEKIREAEEVEFEHEEAMGEEMDPMRPAAPITPPLTPKEPEDADFEPHAAEPEKQVVIEETIVVEVVEQRKSFSEALLDKVRGRGNAM